MLVAPRAALALALAAPVFPLGNVSTGLAVVYVVAAVAWFVLFVPAPRAGVVLIAGPVLAAVGALGLLPLALLGVRGAVRRFVLATAAVLTAGLAAGLHHARLPLSGGTLPGSLRLDATSSPLAAARVLWAAASTNPDFLFKAVAIGAVAAAFPLLRARGNAGAALSGAALLAAALLPAPTAASLPLVGAAALTALLLYVEPRASRTD
jgi:hypothetical protein